MGLAAPDALSEETQDTAYRLAVTPCEDDNWGEVTLDRHQATSPTIVIMVRNSGSGQDRVQVGRKDLELPQVSAVWKREEGLEVEDKVAVVFNLAAHLKRPMPRWVRKSKLVVQTGDTRVGRITGRLSQVY